MLNTLLSWVTAIFKFNVMVGVLLTIAFFAKVAVDQVKHDLLFVESMEKNVQEAMNNIDKLIKWIEKKF